MEIKNLFLKYLQYLDCKNILDEIYVSKFYNFFIELKRWNQKFNLIGLKFDKDIIIKLFIDSLYFIKTNIISQCETILDIGSGAGFPGIPNAIYLTNKKFFLVDSIKKKCQFLINIKNILKLDNIEIINARAESLSKKIEYREKFDCSLVKAFNPFNISMEIIIPLIRIGGYCVYYASPNQEKIILKNKSIQQILGFKILDIYRYELPENTGKRSLIIVKKMWKTNDVYPRAYKNIIQKPL